MVLNTIVKLYFEILPRVLLSVINHGILHHCRMTLWKITKGKIPRVKYLNMITDNIIP